MSRSLSLIGAALCLGAALVARPEHLCGAEWGEPSPAEQRIADELKKPTEIEFIETPFEDVIRTLEDHHEIEIAIDHRALYEIGVPKEVPITRSLKGTSLRSALRILLGDLKLTYVVRDEVLLITAPERAECDLVYARVYPVADLVTAGSARGRGLRECDYLIQAIMTCIVPESWGDIGGCGTILAVPPGRPTALAVTQDPRVHDQIGAFLEAVREAVRFERTGRLAPVRGYPAMGKAEARIAEQLRAPTEVEFVRAPLKDVLHAVENTHNIPVVIHERALERDGVAWDTPITASLSGVSLGSALRLMLSQPRLTYVIWDEVLLITTADGAETMLVTRIYPLNGLTVGRRAPLQNGVKNRWKRWASSQASQSPAAGGVSSPNQSAAPDQELFTYPDLIKTITELIAPQSWSDVGGPGDLSVVSVGTLEALVVMQTREVHEGIEGLLARPEFRLRGSSDAGTGPTRRSRRSQRR